MPQEKQYDETLLLDRAVHAFWSRGYEATSISTLVELTGVNRASLYAAYRGKQALFLECLKRYDEIHRERFLKVLSESHRPRDAILAAFDAAARPPAETGLPRGCLVVNTALEVSPHDPGVRRFVNASLAAVKGFFASHVEAGQADGTISGDLDPDHTAKSLLGLFLGLRVLMRSRLDQSAVSAVIGQAKAMLTR